MRWLAHRANRNSKAHDDGEGIANETLKLLHDCLYDLRALVGPLQSVLDAVA